MPGTSRRCPRSLARFAGQAARASHRSSRIKLESRLNLSVVACALLLVLGWERSSTAHAAPPKAKPAEAQSEPQVKAILREAVQEFDLGNWTEARALFERAHELQPTARTFRAIGLSAFEEKSYAAAVWNLSQSLTDTRNPLDAAQRTKVEDVLRRARGFVAEYKLELTPSGAELHVDGRSPTLVDGKLLLDPGEHTVRLSAAGYESTERRISARPHENGFLHIALSPEGVAQAAPVAPDTEQPPVAEPSVAKSQARPRFSTRQIAAMGVAGAGVASLAVGLGFGIRAKNKHDASGCDGSDCPDQLGKKLNDKASLAGNVSTATLIIGGAALATGAFLYFWLPREKKTSSTHAQLAPSVMPGLVGVVCGGQW